MDGNAEEKNVLPNLWMDFRVWYCVRGNKMLLFNNLWNKILDSQLFEVFVLTDIMAFFIACGWRERK